LVTSPHFCRICAAGGTNDPPDPTSGAQAAHAGLFQVVVQNDARPARDARMVARIELIRLGTSPK
jgi:hypothetical protein